MKQVMILSTLLAVACATSPLATPQLVGNQADVAQMTGVWRAHVESDDKNIAGDLELRFDPDGEFVINAGRPLVRTMWVRVDHDAVRAALEPYFDPSRAADVYTTFEGSLRNDEMHGIVWERVNFQWVNAGSWSATRDWAPVPPPVSQKEK